MAAAPRLRARAALAWAAAAARRRPETVASVPAPQAPGPMGLAAPALPARVSRASERAARQPVALDREGPERGAPELLVLGLAVSAPPAAEPAAVARVGLIARPWPAAAPGPGRGRAAPPGWAPEQTRRGRLRAGRGFAPADPVSPSPWWRRVPASCRTTAARPRPAPVAHARTAAVSPARPGAPAMRRAAPPPAVCGQAASHAPDGACRPAGVPPGAIWRPAAASRTASSSGGAPAFTNAASYAVAAVLKRDKAFTCRAWATSRP